MFLLPVFLCVIVDSSLLAHYQFWSDSGQAVLDHSGNDYHAVNGLTAATDPSDGVLTARGAYFAGGKTATIPLNTATGTGIPLGTQFSVSAWVLPYSLMGRVYEKWTGTSSKFLFRVVNLNPTQITIEVEIAQDGNWISATGTVVFGNKQWVLLSATVACGDYCEVTGYKNYETVLSYVSRPFLYTDDLTVPSRMGAVA